MTTILITGANRGIGLALAKQAAARGDRVIGTARDPDAALELVGIDGVTVCALDVTDMASIERLAGDTDEAIDLLVLNAGVLNSYGGIDDAAHDIDAWCSVLMTNVAGPYLVARALLPNVERGAGKKIAILSSNMGSSASAGGSAYPYRASKAAASNIAINLATELKPRGIAVGSYHPGWVRTGMGGSGAAISVEESAEGLLKRFDALGPATSGVFEDYSGKALVY